MSWTSLIFVSLGLLLVADARRVKRQARPCPDDCKATPIDISFIVDCSTSVWPQNYTIGLWFVQNFVDKFDIDSGQVRVSLLTFADQVYVEDAFDYDVYSTKMELDKAIPEVPYCHGNATETGLAIRWYLDNQYPSTRPGVRHVLIVLTDGNSQELEVTKMEAERAVEQGLEVFAIGVGYSVTHEELHNIASDGKHVFIVDEYKALDNILERLAFEACDVPPVPSCTFDPVDLVFVIDSSVSIGKPNFTIELEFIKEFVEDFEINPSSARVAAVMYGDRVFEDKAIAFDAYPSKKETLDALLGLTWEHAPQTKTWEGIDFMVDVFSPQFRSHAAHIGIVITDGWSQEPQLTQEAADRARGAGIEMIAVGVGKYGENLDEQELLNIAGQKSRVLTADDFNLLNAIRSQLITTTCQGIEYSLRTITSSFR